MIYTLDSEFLEAGGAKPIDLISIALVCEDGREFYRVSTEFDLDAVWKHAWLRENVMPHLPYLKPPSEDKAGVVSFKADPTVWKSRKDTLADLQAFLADDDHPIFWASFADYDWVCFCQLFGAMVDLPAKYPRYCRDLKQEIDRLGLKRGQLPAQEGTQHDALADAQHNMVVYRFLTDRALRRDKAD